MGERLIDRQHIGALSDGASRRLRVSVYLPTWTNGLAWGRTPRWPEIVKVARRLDEMGVDGLWIADQLQQRFEVEPPMEFWEAGATLGGLAAVTSRVTLGPLVLSAGFRNPALVARMAMTLHELSGGRTVLGFGAGYDEGEHRRFGFPWDRRVARLEEAAAILDDLLHSGTSRRPGHEYTTDGASMPLGGLGAPPLIVGTLTTGPRTMRIVARHADRWAAWLAFDDNRPRAMMPGISALERACAEVGRDPGTLGRIAGVAVRLSGEPYRFGPLDISQVAIGGDARAIAEALLEFEDVVDEVAVYAFPLTAAALDGLAAVMEHVHATAGGGTGGRP